MAVDIIARGLGASAGAAATLANNRLDSLPNGLVYRGAVDYYSDLSQITSPEPGDAYTVKYQGTSGTTPDGTEYAWGEYDSTAQWIAIGPDMSQYQPVLVSGTNIKTINNQSILGSGNMDIATNQAFPTSWPTTSATTTKAFCDVVNADSGAVAGMSYLGEVRWSDLPSTLANAEVVVEIMHGTGTSGKVIHLVLTSGNLAPYRWEYTYWNNGLSVSGWIGFQVENFDAEYGVTSYADIVSAYLQGRICRVVYDESGSNEYAVYTLNEITASLATFTLPNSAGVRWISISNADSWSTGGATFVTTNDIVIPVTYAQLTALKTAGTLRTGAYYRITDYVTKINGTYDISAMAGSAAYVHYAKSAEHPFDIIVQALSNNKLSENASAIQHAGDTYFANSSLTVWQLKYTVENNPLLYAWADTTNGKGVIYYMKDEFGNECHYDFKNIQYIAYAITYDDAQYADDLCYDASTQPNRYGSVYYVFQALSNYLQTGTYNSPFPDTWHKDFSVGANILGTIQFPTVDATYLSAFNADWYYTFDEYNTSTGEHQDKTLNSSGLVVTYGNVVGRAPDGLAVALSLPNIPEGLPNIIFEYSNLSSEDWCWDNIFANNPMYCLFGVASGNKFGSQYNFNIHGGLAGFNFNSFGNSCSSNSFGANCNDNSFGNSCNSNFFGDNCDSNSFGNNCDSNSFGVNCHSNSFGNSCNSNSFGNSCNDNSFCNYCYYNSFGSYCYYNSFGNYCRGNSFGNDCYSNSFGNYCFYNSFGNSCNDNSFGNSCQNNSFGNNCDFNTVSEDVYYIEMVNNTSPEAAIGRYTILSGQYGVDASNKYQLTISTPLSSQNYPMYVGLDTSSTVRIWNPATPFIAVTQGLAEAGKFLVVDNTGDVVPTSVPAWQGGSF